ncbi:MAG TPA: SRPBCC family protein [Cryptosporangiaceae bacterium]|nr:SRPBCC family protein [Cryptosporangiaceae bacterium]
MSTIERSIDVRVPISTAYNQWTQFESFPQFMEGVESVQQVTDTKTHWKTSIGGITREFDAEITEQRPDERIAWAAVDGPDQGGVVTFEPLGPDTTRVNLVMKYEPEGVTEKVGDALGLVERRVQSDLERFRDFIESTGVETGAWRGEVSGVGGDGTGLSGAHEAPDTPRA